MISKIKGFLSTIKPPESTEFDKALAIVCLLCEVSAADEKLEEEEKVAVLHTLEKLLDVDEEKANELLTVGMQEIKASNSVFDFTSQLSDLNRETRLDLIQAMWEVAYADGHLDVMEEALIRKVAALIYVNHSDFIRTKLAVIPESV